MNASPSSGKSCPLDLPQSEEAVLKQRASIPLIITNWDRLKAQTHLKDDFGLASDGKMPPQESQVGSQETEAHQGHFPDLSFLSILRATDLPRGLTISIWFFRSENLITLSRDIPVFSGLSLEMTE